jgi:hypothetical protein
MEKKYRVIDNKLNKLLDEQKGKPTNDTNFTLEQRFPNFFSSGDHFY